MISKPLYYPLRIFIFRQGRRVSKHARKAASSGVNGIVISNHGGRSLDTSPPTLSVLPEIVSVVSKEIDILIDGGIRRGTDVLKTLALGSTLDIMKKSENKITIGYFQFLPEFLKIRKNLEEIEKLVESNKKEIKQLDLIIFPEYFLSGPLKLDFIKYYEREISATEIIDSLKRISKISPKTTFVMGSFLLKQKESYSNTSISIKNGEELARYSKKALIYNENYICHSDNKKAVFNVDKVKVGLAICWDLILPEVFRLYVKEADLIVVPSFWGIMGNALQAKYAFSLEKKYYSDLGVARAYENSFALLFVNSVGKYKSSFYSDRMMGGSYFVNPPLGIVHKTNNKNPKALHIIEFNLDPLHQYRDYYTTDKDYFYYKSKKVI